MLTFQTILSNAGEVTLLATKLAIQIQQIVLLINHILVNTSPYFSSQSGCFPLMLATHPGVIKALHQAAATEQVRYRLLYVRCYSLGLVYSGKLLECTCS